MESIGHFTIPVDDSIIDFQLFEEEEEEEEEQT